MGASHATQRRSKAVFSTQAFAATLARIGRGEVWSTNQLSKRRHVWLWFAFPFRPLDLGLQIPPAPDLRKGSCRRGAAEAWGEGWALSKTTPERLLHVAFHEVSTKVLFSLGALLASLVARPVVSYPRSMGSPIPRLKRIKTWRRRAEHAYVYLWLYSLESMAGLATRENLRQ